MKPYPSYKDSGVEWIGEIPSHWDSKRLGMMGIFTSSGIDKKAKEDEPTVNMVNYMDIYSDGSHLLDSSKDYMVVSCPVTKVTEHQIRKGDLLFLPSSETQVDLGLASLVDEELPNTVFSYHLVRFQFSANIYHSFRRYLCNNHFVLSQFSRQGKGTTRQIIGRNVFKNIRVIIPPVLEQKQIVSFLDHKTRKIDELIERTEKKIELLKEKRISLINHCVTKGLNPNVEMKDSGVEWIGEIPEHWDILMIKRLSQVKRGASPRPIDDQKYFDENGEFAWVRIADVTASERYLEQTTQTLSKLGSSLSVKQYPGDFFVSIAGSVGKPIITKIKCCIHDGFVWFPNLKINREFLYYVFSAGELYKGLGKWETQLNLNTETIGDIHISLPPGNEIDNIVSYLDRKTSEIDGLIEKYSTSIGLLKEYRQSLISEVVTGKIDVRDEVVV